MKEKRNFFASKILELEDIMNVDENSISWIQAEDNTQGVNIDVITKNLNTTDLKKNNHSIQIYPNQSKSDIDKFTIWELKIDALSIIKDWIFAQLKRYKTFEFISNEDTKLFDIDKAIYEYIDYNIIPRIRFKTILLYIRYFRISELDNTNNVALQYDAKYDISTIIPEEKSGETTEELMNRITEYKQNILVTNYDLRKSTFNDIITILYKQTENAQLYKFNYYFDVIYEKA
jgi:hypothetical protein